MSEALETTARAPGREHAGTGGALDRLLERVRGRITRLVWIHGLSTAAGAVALFVLVAFVLDWGLHVPSGVRWVEMFLLGGLPVYLVVRELVRPLRARPDRAQCAVLVERAHPELRELLITAAELDAGRRRRAPDPNIAARIRADAEAATARLDVSRTLDSRGPRLRFLLGTLASVACAGVLIGNPEAARVFLDRLFGGDTPWPQRTHLAIEVPVGNPITSTQPLPGADGARSAPGTGAPAPYVEMRVARGSDVSVVVRAEGAVPDEVTLHFSGGHRAVIAASGSPVFRTLLRSVQENLEMYATGGDDQDQDPTVRLTVLRPPDIVGLAVVVEPPGYSRLPARQVDGGDVEVLAGSRLTVHVRPEPADATGKARVLPEDRVIDLTSATFPIREPVRQPGREDVQVDGAQVDGTPGPSLAFTLSPETSLRYRIELLDREGLANPDPGLFAISVIEDRAPEVEVLAPGRGDYDTVPGGRIALRARARDDFGIARMSYTAVPASQRESAGAVLHDLPWRPASLEERRDPAALAPPALDGESSERDPAGETRASKTRGASSVTRVVVLGRASIEVTELCGPEGAVAGTQVEVSISAADNREPTAREGKSSPLRVRIVSPDEYLRRLQDRLARARTAAAALSELQRTKQLRTLDLLGSLGSDALLSGEAGDELFAAATGERRVEGDARSLSRELCSALEGVLYARLDERGGPLLDRVDARFADSERAFDPEAWREIAAEQDAASNGALTGRLLVIAGLALEISEVHAPAATKALARAQDARDPARVHTELTAASESQKVVVEKLESLLERLAEWDNFQSVLGLTRDILNGQKNLSERTRNYAKEH